MFHIRVECVLHKSVEEVFEAITDHTNYKRFPGINDSKLVEEGEITMEPLNDKTRVLWLSEGHMNVPLVS